MIGPFEVQRCLEIREHSRILGLSIDQALGNVKNIIIHSNYQYWDEDANLWRDCQSKAEDILIQLMDLERQLSKLAFIYGSFNPTNPETTKTPPGL